jgi:hypothetical protein
MGRLLLVGSAATTWREWLKENRNERDLICLDPAEPSQSPPGRLCLFHGDKAVAWRFYGSLDAQRAPHLILAALAALLSQAADDAIVQLFAYRNSPLMRHLAMLVAQMVQPTSILVPAGAVIDQGGYPVGPEEVELDPAFPAVVQGAQRKAQWMKLIENCTEQEVSLDDVAIEGARLGSGARPTEDALRKAGLEGVLHAEVSSGTLLLVTEQEPEDNRMSRALDMFHCSRANVVSPHDYTDLLCSFARQSGEDFGMGIVRKIDFAERTVTALCTAVPPAPVRILRLGGLRVDLQGREEGELRPWQV